jgi:hypothetical protein
MTTAVVTPAPAAEVKITMRSWDPGGEQDIVSEATGTPRDPLDAARLAVHEDAEDLRRLADQ